MQDAYNEVPYVGRAFSYTHPDRLAVHGVLAGLRPPPVENCRVLELGCGDGGNLVPMAYGLPGSQFLGIDLAAKPVAAGEAWARELGLANLEFQALNILDFPAGAGSFDYIIAHGIYSWVPLIVREKLFAICQAHLSPHGIAYVSYQTSPGSHGTSIVHGMMRYQASRLQGATEEEIVRAGVDMLRSVINSAPEPDLYHALLARELQTVEERLQTPHGYSWVYHDLGTEISEPVYFHQFMEQAARHGLQFLSELRRQAPNLNHYTPETAELLQTLHDDPLATEQYQDFLADRNFRRTLLCRADAPAKIPPTPERVSSLYAAGHLRSGELANSAAEDPLAGEDFLLPDGPKITVNHPLVKAALRRVGREWPAAVSIAEVTTDSAPEDAGHLTSTLLVLFRANLLQLATRPPRMALTVSERPTSSACARLQIRRGLPTVTNLRHVEVEIKEAAFRQLLLLLDGTRNRAEISRDWQSWMNEARVANPDLPPPERLEAELEQALQHCLRQQLLIG